MSPEHGSSLTAMKMNVRSSETTSDALVLLTEREAEEVARALLSRTEGKAGYQGPGYHLYLEDGAGSELTIGVLDPE
jgi:hypothetical protein